MSKQILIATVGFFVSCSLVHAAYAETETDTMSPKISPVPADPCNQTQVQANAEKQFKDGRKALFQGKYRLAIDLLKKAVEEDEAKASYRLYLARAYYYAEQKQEAEKLLAGILKETAEHVEAGQLLAEIYAKQKKWKGVVKVLEPLLKYRHDYPTYHLLAEAKYNLNDYEKARKYFEEAIKLNAKSGSDHYQLGNIYLASNSFALAAESYQAALRLGVDTPVLHYKLGSAYFNLRNYFGKISVVTVKAGKTGTISGNWYLIESVPGKKDVFRAAPRACAVYQVAKAVSDGIKDSPDIQFLFANIYLNARRYKQAYEMFKKLEPKIPKEDKALSYYYHAQSAFGVHRYDEYLELLRKAIKLDEATYSSALVDAYLKVADRHNQAGKLDKYIQFLAKAVQESPETASLHLKLGHAFEEAQEYAKAIAQWQMVLDLEPDHPRRMELLNLIGKYRKQLTESDRSKAP
jgi:tetratricopeptide (TPR) repeat protein